MLLAPLLPVAFELLPHHGLFLLLLQGFIHLEAFVGHLHAVLDPLVLSFTDLPIHHSGIAQTAICVVHVEQPLGNLIQSADAEQVISADLFHMETEFADSPIADKTYYRHDQYRECETDQDFRASLHLCEHCSFPFCIVTNCLGAVAEPGPAWTPKWNVTMADTSFVRPNFGFTTTVRHGSALGQIKTPCRTGNRATYGRSRNFQLSVDLGMRGHLLE